VNNFPLRAARGGGGEMSCTRATAVRIPDERRRAASRARSAANATLIDRPRMEGIWPRFRLRRHTITPMHVRDFPVALGVGVHLNSRALQQHPDVSVTEMRPMCMHYAFTALGF
jgi:hypothetical protein